MFTIKKRLLVLGVSGIIPIVGVGGAGYQAVLTLQREMQAIVTSSSALRNHWEADMLHDALRGDVFAGLAAGTEEEKAKQRASFAAHARQFREAVTRNQEMSVDPQIAAGLSVLRPTLESYLSEGEAVMASLEHDRDAAVARLPRFQHAFESLEQEQEKVSGLILKKNEAAQAQAGRAVAHSEIVLAGLAFIAAAGLSFAAWLLGRAITRPLSRGLHSISAGSRQVAGAAAQISESAQKLAEVAGRQAAALDETSASAEEVRALAEKSAAVSSTAASTTVAVVQGVGRVNGAVRDSVVSMDEIVDSSSKISRIIKVIEEIAFQTNILALNAAVEAARAGEAGLGFAVVADEVRNLARRSAEASRNTAALIEEAISRSQSGKQKLDEVSSLIAAVTTQVETVQSLSEEVQESSSKQASAIQEIARAVAEMQAVTQQIAANVEENAAASEELTAQAAKVDAAIDDVAQMVGGIETSGVARRASVERGTGMFEWNSRFEIGNQAVDAQHQKLFGLARQLYNAMNAGLGREVLTRLLQDLLQYTVTHFEYEERLMQESGYPGFAQHKAKHDALTQKVRQFAAEFQAGRASVSIELMAFLRDWLSEHILKADIAYQPHLEKTGMMAKSRG